MIFANVFIGGVVLAYVVSANTKIFIVFVCFLPIYIIVYFFLVIGWLEKQRK